MHGGFDGSNTRGEFASVILPSRRKKLAVETSEVA